MMKAKKNMSRSERKSSEATAKLMVGAIAAVVLLLLVLAVSLLFEKNHEDLYSDVGYYWTDGNNKIVEKDGKKVENPYYPYMVECLNDKVFANTDWGEDGAFHGTRAVTRQEAATLMTNVYGMDVTAKLLQDEEDGAETFTFDWLKKKMLEIAGVKKIGVEWDVEDRLEQTVSRYDMAKAMVGFKKILLEK